MLAVPRGTRTSSSRGAIGAVFAELVSPRAKVYRGMHDIPESWGTACNVQAMVFGNMGRRLGGHGRRLHPRSVDRRAPLLRRVAAQRPG